MIDSTVRHRGPPDRSLETTGWRRGIAKSVILANAERPLDSTPSTPESVKIVD